ncbi:hypothetical protein RJ640_011504 [Escallonia rubra]|uniref:Terpene synthase metal-binding domain-containing protein n=1 Tax=Escallonia rubra TaxID=112253 RepID=A0AA88RI05_9ASTE|nr:hypothetical protein RJ640_011504 [Escallonia rubra]
MRRQTWQTTRQGSGRASFARDMLVENFFWTVGGNFEPQFQCTRRITTKITIIDDIYDVYGTLEELDLFTNAVERWEFRAMDQLLDYIKVCFLCLLNSINEMAYDVLRNRSR